MIWRKIIGGGEVWICGVFLRLGRVAICSEVWFGQVLPELDEQALQLPAAESHVGRASRGQLAWYP